MKRITGLVVLFSAVLMFAGVSFAVNGVIDTDGDGVMDGADLCPESVAEVEMCEDGIIFNIASPKPNRRLTTQYCDDPFLWAVVVPNGRANGWFNQVGLPTMQETFGCSCLQIVEIMMYETGEDLDGQIKHGCSKSLIEDFMYNMGCRNGCDINFDTAIEACALASETCHTACEVPVNECVAGCGGDPECEIACIDHPSHDQCHVDCFDAFDICVEAAYDEHTICYSSCL